ncbi:MFS general substrate transporter [Delitschia confertaspora ATCC 74209]|uniref:MFS general substrate transporter n=1 Tax=Delitschia confertaspora ATCC 74209 TaxID=1513339 RepID=A0A9P4MXW9_9PLEO|nr:MFS general substrate transporter [Delitschia confertaspora ATCC 74209]
MKWVRKRKMVLKEDEDKTIIGPAIPPITNTFRSLSHIGWYSSAYTLTLCTFQLLWGRLYTHHAPFPTFFTSIFLFELGSLICAISPTSAVFILGRAIAGIGSAGISNGSIVLVVRSVPLERRPVFQSFFGVVYGVASVVGPVVGGVLTETVGWRWCFWINLPCGGVVLVVLVLVLGRPFSLRGKKRMIKKERGGTGRERGRRIGVTEQVKSLDPLGTALFMASIVCLLLALQWGGTAYQWSSWRIILLLVLFPILLLLFLLLQHLTPSTHALLPLHILTHRTIASSLFYTTTSQASMLIITYYIPLYFQVLRSYTPLSSGLATIPSILSLVLGTILAGALVQKLVFYPAPFMYLSSILTSIGAGLISTWGVEEGRAGWIGYQVLFGFGVGCGMQQPSLLSQIVLERGDVPRGIGLMFFGQNFGGAVGVGVAQGLFADTLAEQISTISGLHLDKEQVGEMGATELKRLVPKELLGAVLEGYGKAIRNAFYVGVGLAGVSAVGAVGVEWRSIRREPGGARKGVAAEERGTGEVKVDKRGQEIKGDKTSLV